MSVYLHRVPGRIRIKADQLREQNADIQALCLALSALEGVVSLGHNAKTGSLLIHYRGEACEAEISRLLQPLVALPAPAVSEQLSASANQLAANFGRTLATSVVQVLSQQLARRLVERALFGIR